MATVYKPSLLYLGFLALPFSPIFPPPFPSFPAPPSFSSLPTDPSMYAYNMPIQLLYMPVLRYAQL